MAGRRRYVWDVPTRVFHWAIVALIAFSWWSAKNDHLDWHLRSGMAILVLLVFRLIWGVVGTDTARFRQFVRGPRGVWSYLRGTGTATIGHNAIGGWSVVALLATLVVQVTAGLFAVDVDGIDSGPLSHWLDFDQGRIAAKVHAVTFNLLLALMALHVLAIAWYLLVRRRNLVTAMVTGRERIDHAGAAPDAARGGWLALTLAVVVAVLLGWWVWGGARF